MYPNMKKNTKKCIRVLISSAGKTCTAKERRNVLKKEEMLRGTKSCQLNKNTTTRKKNNMHDKESQFQNTSQ